MSLAETKPNFDVAEQAGHVEVRGVSGQDVLEALKLLDKIRYVQAEQVSDKRDALVHVLMASNISLTPPATLAQARRLASQRDALLATPVLTYKSLRELRGDAKESTTRTWVARKRARRSLFVVAHGGRTLIPAFQMDARGEPRPELQPLLATLLDHRVDSWPLWTWLTSSTSLLSGEIPEVTARTAPARALNAASRFAAPKAA
jgi:hypothetical protein